MKMTQWLFALAALTLLSSSAAFASSPYVVLIPGAGSSGDRIWLNGLNWATPILGGDHYFAKMQSALKDAGVDSFVCPRTADQDHRTAEERENECVSQILAREGEQGCGPKADRHVSLLGHSMGGLIARELASDSRVESCIRSATLVSTPNQGTPLADWAIDHALEDAKSFDLIGKLVEMIDFVPSDLHYLPSLRVDRTGLAPEVFAGQDTPDNPAVQYFSVLTAMSFIWVPPLEVTRNVLATEIKNRKLDQTEYGAANDGIVPEYSMPHGTVIGRLNAHHWASACVDPVKDTPECQAALALVVPHLRQLARER